MVLPNNHSHGNSKRTTPPNAYTTDTKKPSTLARKHPVIMRGLQSKNLENPQQATPPQSPGTHTEDTEESSSAASGQPAVQIMRRFQSNNLENPQQATPPQSPGTHTGDTEEASSAASCQPAVQDQKHEDPSKSSASSISRSKSAPDLDHTKYFTSAAKPQKSVGGNPKKLEHVSTSDKPRDKVDERSSSDISDADLIEAMMHMNMPSQPSTPLAPVEEEPNPVNVAPEGISDERRATWMRRGGLYECTWCGIVFRQEMMYVQHLRAHVPGRPWDCVCGYEATDPQNFNEHYISHQHNCRQYFAGYLLRR